jgi:hypothetical protein
VIEISYKLIIDENKKHYIDWISINLESNRLTFGNGDVEDKFDIDEDFYSLLIKKIDLIQYKEELSDNDICTFLDNIRYKIGCIEFAIREETEESFLKENLTEIIKECNNLRSKL